MYAIVQTKYYIAQHPLSHVWAKAGSPGGEGTGPRISEKIPGMDGFERLKATPLKMAEVMINLGIGSFFKVQHLSEA